MSCRRVRVLMSSSLDAQTSIEEELQLEQHLEECAACRRRWQGMWRVDAILRAPDTVLAPAGFADSVMGRVEAIGLPARSSAVDGRWLGIVIGLILLFSLSLLPIAGLVVVLGVDFAPALSTLTDLLAAASITVQNAMESGGYLLESLQIAVRAAISLQLVLAALSAVTIFAALLGSYTALLVRYERTVTRV